MGCWDVYCFICGNPCHSMFNEELVTKDIALKILYKKTKWMNRCTMLQINDNVIHGVKEMNCNNSFCKNNKCITHLDMGKENEITDKYGVFIHTDCWKYIKSNYNIKLKFSYLPPLSKNFKYGDIEKYWDQDFKFTNIVIDKKEYLCSSPLKNDKNISQIKKNINQLKIRNDPSRKAPLVSSTFYKDGDIKIGNNKKFHIIKKNKWIEINSNIIKIKFIFTMKELTKKQYNYIAKIPYIGEHNTNPIFILSLNKLKKEKYEVEFILLDNYKDELIKFLPIIL